MAQDTYSVISGEGNLLLRGKSNSSHWVLKSNQIQGQADIHIEEHRILEISEVKVSLKVASLGNDLNPRMTKKAKDVLKSDAFPIATFFAEPLADTKDYFTQLKGSVFLAGELVDIDFQFSFSEWEGSLWLVGKANTSFSEFGIAPPKDFGGIIQCEDEIEINIHLPLKKKEQH